MALLFLEGCETSRNTSVLARVYETFSASITSGGEGALDNAGKSWEVHTGTMRTKELVASDQGTWIIGWAQRCANTVPTMQASGSAASYWAVENDDGEQIRVEMVDDSDSKPGGDYYRLRVMRGATELATSSERFYMADEAFTWTYFEMKFVIDNSSGSFTGRYWSRKSGGIQTLTWDAANTSVDTQNQSSTGGNQVAWVSNNGTNRNIAIDDIYVCDGTGSANNDFLGPVIVERQDISGDGNTTDWDLAGGASDTEDAWHEENLEQEDDKRLTSRDTNEVHLATLTALSVIEDVTVVGVRLDLYARMETSNSLTIASRWRKTTGTPAETNGDTTLLNSTSVLGITEILEQDPNTAAAWLPDDLDSYEVGVRNQG